MELRELLGTTRKAEVFLTVKDFEQSVEFFTFRGIATTPKEDLIGDIVEPMGAEFRLPIPLFSKHDSKKPIGEVTFARLTKTGVPYEARIPIVKEMGLVKERVEEAIHEIKYGLVKSVSIGFKAFEDAVEVLKSGGLRFIRWKWLELSLAPLPANDGATITSFKSLDAAIKGALARKDRSETKPPGAAGQPSQRNTMKTVEQRLEELQQQRTASAERMKEINDACDGNFENLTGDEKKEFDDLSRALETTDADIRRQKSMQAAISTAQEVPNVTTPEQGSRVRAGLPAEPKQKKETDPARKGIAYAQYVRIMYHAKGMPDIAKQIADRQRSRLDPRVPMLIKVAVEAGSTTGTPTAGNWGMELVGDETGAVADFLEFLRPQTILGKFGTNGIPNLRRVPFRVPLVGMTDGGDGYWVGEGKAKPLTKFEFSRNHLDPLKVAAITVVTKELLRDSSPAADAMLRDALAAALNERTDIDFIDPGKAAVAGVSPASITNGITPIPASGTGTSANVRTDIRAAFGAFLAANHQPTSAVWIMSARSALSLSLVQNALGQAEFPGITMKGGELRGVPVIVSEYVPTTTSGDLIVLVNAQDIYFNDDGAVQVDTSEHASLEMDTAPTHDSVTPTETTLVSMYQTNSVAFRAERTIDWLRRRSTAVQVIENANWGEA